MSMVLQLSPLDPLVARDGRPFGINQGHRMRGLPWPLPSVVAGSFRTALIKASSGFDFGGDIPQRLLQIAVSGVFPVHNNELYLPAPNDCVWDETKDQVYRVQPVQLTDGEGVDFPSDGLWPVRLHQDESKEEFKAKPIPTWWPLSRFCQWLIDKQQYYRSEWFKNDFLNTPIQEYRDHVSLDDERGTAVEGKIFATAGLNVTHMPRFVFDGLAPFHQRWAEVTLTARVQIPESETKLKTERLNYWHPLGGERRLVHWMHTGNTPFWTCPDVVKQALIGAKRIRMILATPAVFKHGWKPGWLLNGLEGEVHGVKLKLVGVSNGRWKAVSGWSLAQPRGPKPIRRMVPAGSVYFFEVDKPGDAAPLTEHWLESVSDDKQEQRDGFGLAVWGTW